MSPNRHHPHIYTTSTSGPTSVLGAKPKCGVSQQMASQLSRQNESVFPFPISASKLYLYDIILTMNTLVYSVSFKHCLVCF